jgi:hypothetical protein
MRCVCNSVKNPEGREHSEDLETNGMILKHLEEVKWEGVDNIIFT